MSESDIAIFGFRRDALYTYHAHAAYEKKLGERLYNSKIGNILLSASCWTPLIAAVGNVGPTYRLVAAGITFAASLGSLYLREDTIVSATKLTESKTAANGWFEFYNRLTELEHRKDRDTVDLSPFRLEKSRLNEKMARTDNVSFEIERKRLNQTWYSEQAARFEALKRPEMQVYAQKLHETYHAPA